MMFLGFVNAFLQVLAIIGIILLIFTFFSLIIIYNKGIQLKNYTEEAFSPMDVYLKKDRI